MKKILFLLTATLLGMSFAPAFAFANAPLSSYNWSGYAARGGTYSSVAGGWQVPETERSGETRAAVATWIGIGGMGGNNALIQTGTRGLSEHGTVSYEAWYEVYPKAPVSVPLAVGDGDQVFASISRLAGDSWIIYLENRSTGRYYLTTAQYSAPAMSAEWILERPQTASGLMTLSRSNGTTFTDMRVIKNGKAATAVAAFAEKLTMTDERGAPQVVPSDLSPRTGMSFVLRPL